jgi:restriction system protein
MAHPKQGRTALAVALVFAVASGIVLVISRLLRRKDVAPAERVAPTLASKPAGATERVEPAINVRPVYSAARSDVDTPQAWSLDLIQRLEWKRFETLCAAYFAAKGYRNEVTQLGADGGIDIIFYGQSPDRQQAPLGVVQCKAWNTYKVGVKPVRELYGVMAAEQAPMGIFMTSGVFTKEAEAFAAGKRLMLVNGEKLLALICALPLTAQRELLAQMTSGDYTTPSCPTCGEKMVVRTSRRGQRKGRQFWGCRHYPRCRNTLQCRTTS